MAYPRTVAGQSRWHRLTACATTAHWALARLLDEAGVGARGGFGILVVQQLADDVLYNEQANEVVLVKYLEEPPK